MGTELVQCSGDIPLKVSVVPEVEPDDEIEISASGETPNQKGFYICHFRLLLPNDKPIGDRIWVDIKVI